MASLGPFAKGVYQKSRDVVTEQLSRVDAQQAADAAKAGLTAAKTGVASVDYKEIAVSVKDWVRKNPRQASFHAASLLVAVVPGLVAVPALHGLGYGAQGVVAGSRAASLQAGVGNVAAKSTFAYLQSAAMGGYGSAVVNGVVQGAAVAGQAVGAFVGIRRGQEQQQGGQGEGGDADEGFEPVGKTEAGGSEDGGPEPVVEDGTIDTEDEATIKYGESKL